jgi:transposase
MVKISNSKTFTTTAELRVISGRDALGRFVSNLHLNADELRQLYWERGLSQEEIASLYGVTRTCILKWMKRLGIPTRHSSQYKEPKIDVSKLSETDKAYIAGILDGEGSISILHDKRRRDPYVCIHIYNTSRDLMEWLSKKLNIEYRVKQDKQARASRRTCYEIQVVRFLDVVELLKALVPYLIVKRSIAEHALELSMEILNKAKEEGRVKWV